MLKKALFAIAFFLSFFLSGCAKKFDKTEWANFGLLGGSDKTLMAEDLIKTHKLIGLTNKQMVNLLGLPENDTTATWYGLEQEGEFLSPDPVSGKNLTITFNKDSVIIHAVIERMAQTLTHDNHHHLRPWRSFN